MSPRRPVLAALLAAVSLGAAPASAQEPTPGERLPVREHTLANGLRLLVLHRPGAPTVSFVAEYGVGGVHERLGTTGTAHLLEHLFFKGTRSVGTRNVAAEEILFRRMDAAHDTLVRARARADLGEVHRLNVRIAALEDSARVHVEANEYDRILTKAGARGLNATTSNDATTYYVELPSNRAELWFVLEGDRMANPVFREFYAERDVVMEERRMRVESSPGGLLYEEHLAAAYTVHPYGVPVVGTMSDLENLSRRDVEDYHRRYYGARNAVLGVVGNVDPERIVAWAEKYLAGAPAGEEPPPVLAREPVQRGERRVEVVWDAEPSLRIGWHVPDALHPDAPALSILANLLTGGRTARLHRRLVLEDRLATGVTSSLGPGERFPQLFQIDASPLAPHTAAEVEAAVYAEMERLAAEGPSVEELERVRNQIAAGNVRRLQSNLGLAFQLVESESLFGDWRETFRMSERLRSVTPDDVMRVVGRYFTSQNRTVATLVRAEPKP
ncbi:MAG TPA: pitrilysin family protein [Longimicrobiales bacterium]|nr:pitrilysin family protein [Longimicrobiales bacterium]